MGHRERGQGDLGLCPPLLPEDLRTGRPPSFRFLSWSFHFSPRWGITPEIEFYAITRVKRPVGCLVHSKCSEVFGFLYPSSAPHSGFMTGSAWGPDRDGSGTGTGRAVPC